MSCIAFKTKDIQGILCLPDIYEFEGIMFEYKDYIGFNPVNKRTLEIRKTLPKGYYKTIDKFFNLPDKKKKKYLVQ